MLIHMKEYHAREFLQVDPAVEEETVPQNTPQQQSLIDHIILFSKEKKKALDRDLILWLVGSMRPYSIVEERWFETIY